MTPDPLLLASDVMARLGCSRSFVQDHRAELGARKIGRLLRFPREAVEAFVARGQIQAPAPAEPKPTPLRARLDLRGLPPVNPVTKRAWSVSR